MPVFNVLCKAVDIVGSAVEASVRFVVQTGRGWRRCRRKTDEDKMLLVEDWREKVEGGGGCSGERRVGV